MTTIVDKRPMGRPWSASTTVPAKAATQSKIDPRAIAEATPNAATPAHV